MLLTAYPQETGAAWDAYPDAFDIGGDAIPVYSEAVVFAESEAVNEPDVTIWVIAAPEFEESESLAVGAQIGAIVLMSEAVVFTENELLAVVASAEDVVTPSITINGAASRNVSLGGTLQLTAAIEGDPAPVVAWSSDDTDVATVSASGLVTGVAEGSCTITAEDTDLEVSDTVEINVLVISGRRITVVTNITNIGTIRK